MGKGGGCVPSKKTNPLSLPVEPRRSVGNQAISEDAGDVLCGSVSATEGGTSIAITQLKIFIVFYSMYGHVRDLARRMKRGVDSVEGVEGLLFQVPETLPGKVLDQMKAPSKDDDIPVISAGELPEADGFLFGFPTRFGCMAAQMKTFFDSTGQLWKGQKLSGKPAGFFVSTGTQGGGQETTVLTAITQLAHHGMLFVPIGYTFGASMFRMDSIRGGSPYGSGAFSGDGSRGPAESELALAEYQGNYMAEVVKKLSTRQATHD